MNHFLHSARFFIVVFLLLACVASHASAQSAIDYVGAPIEALLWQAVRMVKFENRRRDFDLDRYVRANTPTAQEEREHFRQQQLLRALTDPSLTEIRSAKALNDLLVEVQILQARGIKAEQVPLPKSVLGKVNMAVGGKTSHAGLLKKGRLVWPVTLRGDAFERDREQIERLTWQAVNQAFRGGADLDTLENLSRALTGLDRRLRAMAKAQGDCATWSPAEYMAAKRFLSDCDQTLKVLQQPDADVEITLANRFKGKTVAELVRFMTTNGLRFAPATIGDEGAYLAVQRALADHVIRLHAHVAKQAQLRAMRPLP